MTADHIARKRRKGRFYLLVLIIMITLNTMTTAAEYLPVYSDHDNSRVVKRSADYNFFNEQVTIEGNFSIFYNESVQHGKQVLFRFMEKHLVQKNNSQAVRLSVSSPGANESYPVIFVVRQQQSVLSWQVPLMLNYKYAHYDVSRTLCPIYQNVPKEEPIYVEVTSLSPSLTHFTLEAWMLPNFDISIGSIWNMTITPSEPMYMRVRFPSGVDSLILHATSDDRLCTVMSAQDTRCPVFDLDRNVDFTGVYQTWTTKASVTITRTHFPSGDFFVIFIVKATNEKCSLMEIIGPRTKSIKLRIQKTITDAQLATGIAAALLFYLSFYVMAGVIVLAYNHYEKRRSKCLLPANNNAETSPLWPSPLVAAPSVRTSTGDNIVASDERDYGAITTDHAYATALSSPPANEDNISIVSDDSNSSMDTADIDFLHDLAHDKNIIRRKVHLFVSDMARKSYKKLDKQYNLYFWNLFTITIFYGLPVIQLVMTYHRVVTLTGNEDTCWFNFECAHEVGVFGSFNNVFSNIGYILLGLLFSALAYRRSRIYKRNMIRQGRTDSAHALGIPQHFGLYYAMGWALVMEGFMSACYHVCPNYSNFQFDTAFMYVIAILCMLKLYQIRHPDINAKAHSAYLVIACLIFMAVIGVVYSTALFWGIFTAVYLIMVLCISLYLYYMGQIRLNLSILRRLLVVIRTECFSKPTYPKRFVLLLLVNMINWAIALYGAITQPKGFASFFLAMFISNLLLYTFVYLIMKVFSREKILLFPCLYILLASVLMGFSLWFFFRHLTSWQKTPAESREGNKPCILLDFYDAHDVWHFLSAISLFFSFMVALTLDDDLVSTRRDKIRVF